jgi:putative MATE family efflux protein
MGVMPENRLLLSMAVPTALSMLTQALYNIVDSVFVAQIGESALTAVSMTFPIQALMTSFSAGAGVGMTQLLSKSLGEKNYEGANRAAAHGVVLSLMLCGVFVLFGLVFSKFFFELQNVDAGIALQGGRYLFITTVFSLGIFIQFIYDRMLLSTGKALFPMISQISGAALNLILDPLLIFGWFGFPALGVTGAAIATVFSQWIAAVLAFVFHLRTNRAISMKREHFRLRWPVVKAIWGIGSSALIKQGSGSVLLFCVNNVLLGFTATATAVYGVFYRLYVFFITPVWALTSVLIPLTAYNFGMKKRQRVWRLFKLSMAYTLAITATGVVLLCFFPGQFLALFNAAGEMKAIGMIALPILCVYIPLQACSAIMIAALQGLGEGKGAIVSGICERLLFPLVVMHLLAMTGTLDVVWWSFAAAESLGLLVCSLLTRRVYVKKLKIL